MLALTLPFLLDGDLSARRVEPDGDPGKRMEWNLLLGGAHPHPERLGYTWIEFGRLDGTTGEAHVRTLLCGLKAVAGRGIARHWFAVTDQRIGAGLDLLDATRTALSRDRLAEAVGDRGMVYDTAKAYRRAVDEALFGLGERRYGALVDLLIQLRQPQLSKRPSEAALSRALTEALPPMDQAVVADAAEAFRSLDEEKENCGRPARPSRHPRRSSTTTGATPASPPGAAPACPAANTPVREPPAGALQGAGGPGPGRGGPRGGPGEGRRPRRAGRAAGRPGRHAPLPAEMRDARALDRAADDASRTAGELKRAVADRSTAAEAHTRALGRLATADNRLTAAREVLDDILARVAERRGCPARRAQDGGSPRGGPAPGGGRGDGEQAARRRARGRTRRAGRAGRGTAPGRPAARRRGRRGGRARRGTAGRGGGECRPGGAGAGHGRAGAPLRCVELRVPGLPGSWTRYRTGRPPWTARCLPVRRRPRRIVPPHPTWPTGRPCWSTARRRRRSGSGWRPRN
ncbi:hypothetical protein ACR6C2_34815 [Streptomyces sp. INA 01156]